MPQDESVPAEPARIDRDDIPVDAQKVLGRLSRHGFAAYLVGGCVRDLLLDVRPKDFDIATSARPQQVKRLFRNCRIIGRRFRLVHIHFGPRVLEVATFRAPPDTEDDDPYIHRDNVFGTEEQDARRRDFTINALFYDLEGDRVIDHVGGLDDLEHRVLRTIGDADVRLREDPVRILRAARFAGRLDFTLAPDLESAARDHREDLRKAAAPRVLEELYRLLSGKGASRAFRLLHELGSLGVMVPELDPVTEAFYQLLGRLEERTGGDRNTVQQSILLAALSWPWVAPALLASQAHDHEAVAKDSIQPLCQRFTVARRDSGRARQVLAAQARLAREPKTRSDKRFCRREYFGDALLLRSVVGPLVDSEDDPLERWEQLVERTAPGPAPSRRRRRRRKRKPLSESGSPVKDEACPSQPESSSAPARKRRRRRSRPPSSSSTSSPA
jgi:poly(A) polymerase